MFPIITTEQLPPPGTSSELPELDFKRTVDVSDSIELAKDIAALANTVGGSIIVGADAQGQTLARYVGITEKIARQAAQGYEVAVKTRCLPTPYLETRILLTAEGLTLLAVNVWMSPVAPVGVRIYQSLPNPVRLLDEAWVFPRRVGSQTTYLQPDQFGAFEHMSARRATALLLGIPESERTSIRIRWSKASPPHAATTQNEFQSAGHLEGLSLEKNVARFRVGDAQRQFLKPLLVPLDCINTVWRDDIHNEWQIVLDAVIVLERDHYVPYPHA